MSIVTTGTGTLSNRLGVLGGAVNEINLFRGSTAGQTRFNVTIDGQWSSGASTQTDLVDQLFTQKSSFQSSFGTILSYYKSLAQNIIIRMADDDQVLVTKDLPTALKEMIYQMKINPGAKIVSQATSISATVTKISGGSGDGTVVATTLGNDGFPLQLLIPEQIDVVISGDYQTNGLTRGQETATVKGETGQTDTMAFDYPGSASITGVATKGSGVSTTLTAVDASTSQGTNLLYNSSFNTYTVTDTPDNWVVTVGVVTTNIFNAGSSVAYDGVNAVGIKGAALTEMAQTFAQTSGGTTSTLLPGTTYHFNCWMSRAASVTGVIDFCLVDGSGNILQDGAKDLQGTSFSGTTFTSASTTATGTKTNHGLVVGQQISVTGAGVAGYNGIWTVATVPTANTFTFTTVGSGLGADASGTAVVAPGVAGISFNVASLATNPSYTNLNWSFRTPTVMPSTTKLRFRITTALAAGTQTIYLDHLAMATATQLYAGGPFFTLFSGKTPFVQNIDKWQIVIASTRPTAADDLQLIFQKFFDLRSLGLYLPITGASGTGQTNIGTGLVV